MVAAAPAWFGTLRDAFHQVGNAVFVVVAVAVAVVAVVLLWVEVLHSSAVVQLEIELLEVEDRTVAVVAAMTTTIAVVAAAAEAEDGIVVALPAPEVLIICLSIYTVSLLKTMQVNCTGKVLALRRAIWWLIGHLFPSRMIFLLLLVCCLTFLRAQFTSRI